MSKYNKYLQKEFSNLPYNLYQIIEEYLFLNRNIKIAFVGGFLRDLLIKKIHKINSIKTIDLDIVIEGSALSLANFIKNKIKNVSLCLIKEYEVYNTVELNIENLKLDIASARKETYFAPGHNPNVTDTIIEEDLIRRDFTINAIAYEISNKRILDLFDGISHIEQKLVHLLHENSIKDDPSRLLRCAKYTTRFGFHMSQSSLNQAQEFIKEWPWVATPQNGGLKFPPGISIRIRMELSEIIKYDNLSKIISELDKWDCLSILNKDIIVDKKFIRGINWIKRIKGQEILYLLKNSKSLNILAKRLFLNSKQIKIILDYQDTKKILGIDKRNFINFSASDWTEFIEGRNLDPETVKLIISDSEEFWRSFFKWLYIFRFIKSKKSGSELKEEGWEPGYLMGAEIKRLRYQEIDRL
tara:strand:- start:905 stop:2143 length:1239 start_codon:yes stop_codon:yes gene_type:complete